jgi:hypothetical protein
VKLGVLALAVWSAGAQPLAVRQPEGVVHGFLSLSTLDGAPVAIGDSEQVVHGARVTNKLTFHFRDGSLQDETTVFSQSGKFRLLSYRMIQKGPAFKRQMDLTVNPATGSSMAHYTNEDGKDKIDTEHLSMPPDIGNGMVPILLKNLTTGEAIRVPMIAATPKPLLVQLAITPDGEETFLVGGGPRKATRYRVKVEIPGVKGTLASILGKDPPDTLVWILGGTAPTFLKSEGPLCAGCASYRMQLLSPTWPGPAEASAERKR